jgi:cell pole-organizing protein PopZ
MSAQPKANEPSMEEILASIRRIISDDEVKPAEAGVEAAPVAEEAPPPPAIEDDVLDLGAEAALVLPPEPEPAASAEGDVDFLEPPPPPEPEPVAVAPPPPAPEPAPAPAYAAGPPQPAFDMAQLLSDQTSSAVTNAFGQLAHTVLTNNARTLEDLVKDMLKPMLKTWLDDNLPTMVERLVRAEIERVARGGRH